ncbi:response regulator [bacterium]|nr:response regulator [bacterium]
MATLLLIDDEPAIQHAFRRVFERSDVVVEVASRGQMGIDQARALRPDVIIIDVGLPDMSGIDVYRQLLEFDVQTPVIFITGHGSTETAIEAVQLGAFDYLFKPLELKEVRTLVEQAVRISRSMRVPALTTALSEMADGSVDLLVGRCNAMKNVYRDIGRIAARDVTVLILGESGTGKELVARAIFQHSQRRDGPFRAVNCAAIPETLLESELFGHEKGAFTGADQRRIGRIEQCEGGTLFLDEIGDMTPLTQAKILRFLQEREFERVGSGEPIKANVRVVAATNRNLEDMVARGAFRADLFYRLNSYTIQLPPLRDREADIDLLAEHFLRKFARDLNRDVTTIAPEVLQVFHQYPWPGNVREFESVIRQALLASSGPVLLPDFLPDTLRAPAESGSGSCSLTGLISRAIAEHPETVYSTVISTVERELITTIMQQTDGNLTQAARLLGITRVTLRNKLREIDPDRSDSADSTDD